MGTLLATTLLALASPAPGLAALPAAPADGGTARLAASADDMVLEERRRMQALQAEVEAALREMERAVPRLEELAKGYASAPDLEAFAPEREALRRGLFDLANRVLALQGRLDDVRKQFETRQGARFLIRMVGLRKDVPSTRRMKTAIDLVEGDAGHAVQGNVSEVFDIRSAVSHNRDRLDALVKRAEAEHEAFLRESESRARVRRLRLLSGAVFGVCLLGGAWLVVRRRLDPRRPAPGKPAGKGRAG